MFVLKENAVREAEFDTPPDVDTLLKYTDFYKISDNLGLKSTVSYTYESAGKCFKLITSYRSPWPEINIKPTGIELAIGNAYVKIDAADMKHVHYQQKNFINGAKPLSTVTLTWVLKDGGYLKSTSQTVGYFGGM